MEHAGTVRFTDLTTPNEARIYVRYGDFGVDMAVFNDWKKVGPRERKEIEMTMKPQDARAVIEALRTAIGTEPLAMREVAAIAFADTSTGEATSITVRHDAASVHLILCNEDAGEVQVAMARDDARALLKTLETAVGA